ncbi:MAG: tetratricopeptide repeat-containing sensor histidine kinase [Bacteroidota bacterium]
MKYSMSHLILFFILIGNNLSSQTADSLKHEITKAESDSMRIVQKIEIANYYINHQYPDSAVLYSDKAIKLAKKINSKYSKAYAEGAKGAVLRKLGRYNESLELLQKAEAYFQNAGLKNELAEVFNEKGIVYYFTGKPEQALENYHAALEIFELNNNKFQIANCYNNIGIIHYTQKSYEKAIVYYKKALPIFNELNKPDRVAGIYNNIAAIYLGEEKYLKAKPNIEKAIEICENNQIMPPLTALYQNMAGIYEFTKQYQKAKEYFQKAIDLSKTLGQINVTVDAKSKLGGLYLTMIDSINLTDNEKDELLSKSLSINRLALKKADSLGTTSVKNNITRLLSKAYERKNDYKNALYYYKAHKRISDSLRNEKKDKIIAEIEGKYENKAKEMEIAQLKNESRLKNKVLKSHRNILILAILGIIIIAIFLIIFIIQNRSKKKAINARNKLLSIIAHDLKNPFASLMGLADIYSEQNEELSQEEVNEFFFSVHHSAKQGYELLENLLEWSRLHTGRLEIKTEKINLKDIVDKSQELLELNAEKKGITLVNHIQHDVFVIADKNSLLTIFRNLLSNAIKFTNAGGKIDLYHKEQKKHIKIYVKDTGRGITKAKINEILKSSSRHSSPGTANELGSGLGMILIKEFVKNNNGTLSIESEINRGTTISITLQKPD